MGTALLALAFAQRANRGAEIPRWIAPRDRDAQRFLDEIGFERFATGHGADREAGPQLGTLEMRQFTALDPVYLRQLSDFLAEHVPGTGESASFAIELCLKELLQNVFEHAESSVGCFVLPRWYQIGENVRLAVVDGGIGIPASYLLNSLVARRAREREATSGSPIGNGSMSRPRRPRARTR